MIYGRYDYWQNGQPVPIHETWQIERTANGARILSERVATAYGSRIHVSADSDEKGRIIACDVVWEHPQTPRIQAQYQLGEDLKTHRQFATQYENGVVALPETAYLMPLLRVFMGRVIHHIVADGGSALVIVPNIIDPTDTHTLLTPLFDRRRAYRIGAGEAQIGDRSFAADCYRYISAQYDESAQFWVNDDGILLRYTWDAWDVRLTRYEA